MSKQFSSAERPHLANNLKSTAAELARKLLDFKTYVDELHEFMPGGPDNGSIDRHLRLFAGEVEECRKELKRWNHIYSTHHYVHEHRSGMLFEIQTIAHQALHLISYSQNVSLYGFDRATARETWAQLLLVMDDRFLREMQTLRLLAGGYVTDRKASHGRPGLLPPLPTTGTLSSLAAASSQHGARKRSGEDVPGDPTRSFTTPGSRVVGLNEETLAHEVRTKPVAGAGLDSASRPPPISTSLPTFPTRQASSQLLEHNSALAGRAPPVSGPSRSLGLRDQHPNFDRRAMSRRQMEPLSFHNSNGRYPFGKKQQVSTKREVEKRSGGKPLLADTVTSLTRAARRISLLESNRSGPADIQTTPEDECSNVDSRSVRTTGSVLPSLNPRQSDMAWRHPNHDVPNSLTTIRKPGRHPSDGNQASVSHSTINIGHQPPTKSGERHIAQASVENVGPQTSMQSETPIYGRRLRFWSDAEESPLGEDVSRQSKNSGLSTMRAQNPSPPELEQRSQASTSENSQPPRLREPRTASPAHPGLKEVATASMKCPHGSPPLGSEAPQPRRQKKSRGSLKEKSSGVWE